MAYLYADSHAVGTDGIVTSGYKLNAIQCTPGSFVIANASDDGNAATMVAKDILRRLERSSDPWNIEVVIKDRMRDWHSGYKSSAPPSMQFILGARLGQMTRRIYFCEPPNMVVEKHLG